MGKLGCHFLVQGGRGVAVKQEPGLVFLTVSVVVNSLSRKLETTVDNEPLGVFYSSSFELISHFGWQLHQGLVSRAFSIIPIINTLPYKPGNWTKSLDLGFVSAAVGIVERGV